MKKLTFAALCALALAAATGHAHAKAAPVLGTANSTGINEIAMQFTTLANTSAGAAYNLAVVDDEAMATPWIKFKDLGAENRGTVAFKDDGAISWTNWASGINGNFSSSGMGMVNFATACTLGTLATSPQTRNSGGIYDVAFKDDGTNAWMLNQPVSLTVNEVAALRLLARINQVTTTPVNFIAWNSQKQFKDDDSGGNGLNVNWANTRPAGLTASVNCPVCHSSGNSAASLRNNVTGMVARINSGGIDYGIRAKIGAGSAPQPNRYPHLLQVAAGDSGGTVVNSSASNANAAAAGS